MVKHVASDEESTKPNEVPAMPNRRTAAPLDLATVAVTDEVATFSFSFVTDGTLEHPVIPRSPSSSNTLEIHLDETRVRHLDRESVLAAFAEAEDGERTRSAPPSANGSDAADPCADFRRARSSAPPKGRTTRSSAPPPALLAFAKPTVAAYARDADPEELGLQAAGDFRTLVELYRTRLAGLSTAASKARLLHKIASVHEYHFTEHFAAFEVLAEAFELHPFDPELVASLDRNARAVGRVAELAARTLHRLETADRESKVLLLEHVFYWYDRLLGRSDEASRLVLELEQLDALHPLVLRRHAHVAAQRGDVKAQRELLARALTRTTRREESARLHLELASSHAGTPEAAKHYEFALAHDPRSLVAIQAFEQISREHGNHAQVEWCLEQLAEISPTAEGRVDALLRLAELYETEYLQRERAAELLERVNQLEPAHPQALKALERCYHALRDWVRLSSILRSRAESSFDTEEKLDLLERAADVLETNVSDPAGAIEVLRDVLAVDPKHRRALGSLVRLCERLGDWHNFATYRARLAELAPSKRQAATQLIQLGDFLAASGRDEIAARIYYERAATIDPTNIAAWEALERAAAVAGDDRRVIHCIEQRALLETIPRQRAIAYVDLARLHKDLGDELGERDAFERALRADPTNEAAAAVLLDIYTRESRWEDAAPLCDLLLNAAALDRDERALFERQRLGTRIYAALGQADRAMDTALAAIGSAPNDANAQADLIAVCAHCCDNFAVLVRAKEALVGLEGSGVPLPTELRIALAEVHRVGGDLNSSAFTLERALANDGGHAGVKKSLAEIYLAQADYPRCCKLTLELAATAPDEETRFRLLCDAGEIWARRANVLDEAARVFEEARTLKPFDHWVLHTLMWLYGELECWNELANVLEDIAELQESDDRKAKGLFALAQVVFEKLADVDRAVGLFDLVLDIDRERSDAFGLMVRALTEREDWAALEQAYRRMIARANNPPDANLLFALSQELGLVYRDRLGDAARAYEVFQFAASLRPDAPEVRKIVTELLVVTDNVDNAVARTRDLLARSPHDGELYAELYELFLRKHDFDKAWCTIDVLAQMRPLQGEAKRFHDDYAPVPVTQIRAHISESAFRTHVLHPDLDGRLGALFWHFMPAIARIGYAQASQTSTPAPLSSSHSHAYDSIREVFSYGAAIFQMPSPLLLFEPNGTPAFALALAPLGAIRVGTRDAETNLESLRYAAGKHLAELRPELVARALFPTTADLAALLDLAIRLGEGDRYDPPTSPLAARLSVSLTPAERETIRAYVISMSGSAERYDVARWSRAADLSRMRAGLLLSGTAASARKAIASEFQTSSDLPPREKLAALYSFATSNLYSELRSALGIAVSE